MGIQKTLVVDDEPEILKLLALSLGRVGKWEVATASTGDQAMSLAAQNAPDVILLDVMMPADDGPSVLRRLKATRSVSSIPVVIMTANAQHEQVAQCLQLGAAGVISKPFNPMALPRQIQQLLDQGAAPAP